jgi:signal transduction histidine kinase
MQASASAQNNPYKIRDSIYGSFLEAQNCLHKKDVGLRKIDSLWAKAKSVNDVKAQCIALFFRVRYFINNNQTDKAETEFRRDASFMLHTPYKQYFYASWEDFIVYLLEQGKTKKAYTEIYNLGRHALSMKNTYGIVRYYVLEGNIRFQRLSYRLAISFYTKALSYGIKNDMSDIYAVYRQTGMCYLRMHRWYEAEKMLLEAIEHSPSDKLAFNSYSNLLSLYCIEDVQNPFKIEKTVKVLQQVYDKYKHLNMIRRHFNEAMYNYYKYYKNDELLANTFIRRPGENFMIDSLIHLSKYALKCESIGDDKNVAVSYKRYADILLDRRVRDNNLILELYVPHLEYQKLEHKKEVLLQQNAMMELTRLRNNEQLLKLGNERNNLLLLQKNKEHNMFQNQYAMQQMKLKQERGTLQNEYLRTVQQKKTEKLEREKRLWRIFAFCMLIISAILVAIMITSIKRAIRQRLKEEKEKAENAKQMKSLFFQNMNHEIRSPLNAIIGFNDVLNGDMSGSITPEQKAEFVKMISTNCQLLQTLVNDVLDLSNFESGTYKLNLVDVDIHQLCYTTLESMRGRELPGVELILTTKPEGPFILHTDAQRLQQVLINYISNACKYTEHGSITLSYEVAGEFMRFAVTDTGRGVKPEDAEKVFRRFQMLEKSKRGTGLGLHICSIVANLLHGKVYVDTKHVGGARFIFDHPLKLLLSLLIALFSFGSVFAQQKTKTMNMKPELFKYYKKIENCVTQPLGNRMSDTLMIMAKQQKDRFAEGYALCNKVRYGRYSGNEKLMLAQFERCKSFCLKYRIYDPLFSSWSFVVNFYLLRKRYSGAMSQLVAFYDLSTKLENAEGISAYFYSAGSLYFTQERFATALSYYMQSLSHGNDEKYSTYTMMGECYYFLKKYAKSIECMKEALSDKSLFSDIFKPHPYSVMVKCYSLLGDESNATKYMDKMEKLRIAYPYRVTNNMYYNARFLYYLHIKKDKTKAGEALFKLAKGSGAIDIGNYYFDKGDYAKAKQQYKEAVNTLNAWLKSDVSQQLEAFTSYFDFGQEMNSLDRISMNAIQLQMLTTRSRQKLLKLGHEKSVLLLKQAEDSMKKKKNDVELQKMLLAQQQSELDKTKYMNDAHKRQHYLEDKSSIWRNTTLFISFLLVLTLLGIYVVFLRYRERQLRAETSKAEREERAKNRFFQNVNSKIRQPLHDIVSLNEKLNGASAESISASARCGMMQQLDASGKYLATLVNDVLDISKMESGTYKLQIQEVDVHTLCLSVVEEMTDKMPNAIELKFVCSAVGGANALTCRLSTDQLRLRYVLVTYIRNAINHTHIGTITLSYEVSLEKIVFCVTDTGEGVPLDIADTIFYYDQMNIDRGEGGLGLHIVKLTAGLVHGRAWLDTSYKGGARFYFEHPIKI